MSTTTDIVAPPSGVKPHLQPWQIIRWTNDQLANMYTDWGTHFARKQNLRASSRYFDASLELLPNPVDTLRRRGEIKRLQAQAPEGLIDCQHAQTNFTKLNSKGFDPKIIFGIIDGLYESNRFEEAKIIIHRSLRLFSESQSTPLLNRLNVIKGNIADSLLGETGPAVHRLVTNMPKDLGKTPIYMKPECDVLSVLEMQEEHLSPLEIKRREREYKIYNQTYLDKCWMDVSFLNRIRGSPNLLIEQFKESTPRLKTLTEEKYKIVRTFTKMLHTRCPKYSHHIKKYPDTELYLKIQQENFFRIQYQTRRNMFKILRTIRTLIRANDHHKLTSFVEEAMGNYVTIKTNRVMPWKFEFINEVYNYLGLARINEFKIPKTMKVLTGRQRLLVLFKIPIDQKRDEPQQIKRINIDTKAEQFNKKIAHFEYRMRFAKHSIERSYLLHEMAQAHLEYHSFDTCCSLARKSMNEALKGRNYIWAVLSALVACKAHAILGKVEKQKEMLIKAFRLAKRLKSIDLCLFIDVCLKVNAEEIELKRALNSVDISIKRKLRHSTNSFDASPSEISYY